jgi:hypothetical protein
MRADAFGGDAEAGRLASFPAAAGCENSAGIHTR